MSIENQEPSKDVYNLGKQFNEILDKFVSTYINENYNKPFLKSKTFPVLLTILVAGLGYFVTWHIGRLDINRRELQQQKNYVISVIQKKIDAQTIAEKSLKRYVLEIRKVNKLCRDKCNTPSWNAEAAKNDRFNTFYDLVVEGTGLNKIFNLSTFQAINSYLHFEENIRNICKGPSDSEWHKLQDNIFDSISRLHNREDDLVTKAVETENFQELKDIFLDFRSLVST